MSLYNIVKVDCREGSKHLYSPLCQMLDSRSEVREAKLRFADVNWTGGGPDDSVITVGVELKTIPDLLNSLESNRLVEHQLPGLQARYDVAWLLIEGRWRPNLVRRAQQIILNDKHGYLDIYSGMAGRRGWLRQVWRQSGWKYAPLMQIICGLSYRFGIRSWRTDDRNETLWWLVSQIEWWRKKWHEHHSGEAWAGYNAFGHMQKLRRPSRVEKFIALFDGIGKDKALPIARKLRTIRNAVNVPMEDWIGLGPDGLTKPKRQKDGSMSKPRKKACLTKTSAMFIQRQLDEPHGKRNDE